MKSNAKFLFPSLFILALFFLISPIKKVLAEYQIFSPGASVTVGDFVYDDSYNPTTTPCTIMISDPSGNQVVNATTTGDSTGWHAYSFVPTPISGPTSGVWPTTLSCGSTLTGDLLKEDKSFIIGFASVNTTTIASSVTDSVWNSPTRSLTDYATSSITSSIWSSGLRTLTDYATSSIASAIWTSPARTLTSFGSLVADITSSVWSNTSRTLTAFGSLAGDVWNNSFAPSRELTDQNLSSGGKLATQADIANATSSVVTEVLANRTLINSLNNISAADVWAYGARTLTSGGSGGAVDLTATSTKAIWDYAKTNLTTSGSIGKLLADNIDTTISSRSTSTLTAADVWLSATRKL